MKRIHLIRRASVTYGLVTWRTETVSPGPSPASELAVRADVEIPERQTTMTWLLRRNVDHALAASHTVEIMFNLPADFAGGGVASVPGIMMKQSEQVPGTPLAKLAVKATNGVFMIELSASDADVQRNVQLLKESQWFDIPIVYVNGTPSHPGHRKRSARETAPLPKPSQPGRRSKPA